jgi:hypothetical protein
MKSQSIKLLLSLLIVSVLFSCKDEKKDTETTVTDAVEKTIEENTKVKEDKQDGPFGVKSAVITYDNKKLDGSLRSTYTFYFDDYGNMLKLEETVDGDTSVYMFNEKEGKGMTAFPGHKPNKMSMRQGELNMLVVMHGTSGYVQQDNEAIVGRDCIVYANNAKSAKGESQHKYWKHKGVLLKEINRLGMGYILEATSFEERALDKEAFSQLNNL